MNKESMTWENAANALQGSYQTEKYRGKLLMPSQKEWFKDPCYIILLLMSLMAYVNEIG